MFYDRNTLSLQGVREELELYSRKCILIRSFIRANIWPRSAISSLHGRLSSHSHRLHFRCFFSFVGHLLFLLVLSRVVLKSTIPALTQVPSESVRAMISLLQFKIGFRGTQSTLLLCPRVTFSYLMRASSSDL